ncbi:SpoIIE family protein phosphatase [Thermodesulfobacteriota bacterium]
MDAPIEIKHFPVFEKGTFQRYPALFDRFFHDASTYMTEEFEKARSILLKCEEDVTWPLITGPGFSGATHPGADNIVIETMFAAYPYIYNSDCLYINVRKGIFAVSDPPGKTTSSRTLFRRLDRHLLDNPHDGLEAIINKLSEETGYDDAATLCLVSLPRPKRHRSPSEAIVYIAGDTVLFHGNPSKGEMVRIDGSPHFIGTKHARFEPQRISLDTGDFIIIASDGINALLAKNQEQSLEHTLLNHFKDGTERFVVDVVQSSNGYYEQHVHGNNVVPRFGGGDNVSVLAIYPDDLIETDEPQSFVLGGYLSDK